MGVRGARTRRRFLTNRRMRGMDATKDWISVEHTKAKIDQSSVTWNTDRSIERVRHTTALALKYVTDPDKLSRLSEALECIPCYYNGSRIGGAAMTQRPCGVCEEMMMFGNTCTDVVCQKCAKQYELCLHCGSDLKMRPRRKWPT